jgi:hypothetical protein
MDNESPEPETAVVLPTTRVERHDGWTGEKMAAFCETLAETAVVADACEAANMGISGAYACRRRNPVFAAAWDAALGIARERLADTLLARSMEGNVEQLYKDGVLVGERHVIDNRLGLHPPPPRPARRDGSRASLEPAGSRREVLRSRHSSTRESDRLELRGRGVAHRRR